MLHEQDSSHPTNIPGCSLAYFIYSVCSGFPQKCSPNFLAPSINKQTLFLPLFWKKWSITLLKPKLVLIALGKIHKKKTHINPGLLILTPSGAGWFWVHPARKAVPSLRLCLILEIKNWWVLWGFKCHLEAWSFLSCLDGFFGPPASHAHANGSFNSTVRL